MKIKIVVEMLITVCLVTCYVLFSPPATDNETTQDTAKETVSTDNKTEDGRYFARTVTDGTQVARDRYALAVPLADIAEQIAPYVVAQTESADDTWFDDAVFIGDSVTACLQKTVYRHRLENDCLGKTVFYSVGEYGLYEATRPASSDKSVHPLINGKKTTPAELVRLCNAKKVYICLGLNDLSLYTTETILTHYLSLINAVNDTNPDCTVYIQSVTPVTLYGETRLLYNAKIDTFNLELAKFAKENGCPFLYISDLFKDTAGYLAYELSTDDDRNLEREACDLWIAYLKTHTAS